ncbi:MarR family winged helix-turn-helix transcriptional regulator [Nocardioides marmoraquaticus]
MVDTATILALEHEMGVLIRRLRRRIAERARLIHPELSPVAYSMLMALHDSGPQRASELVELFSIDKGAVSRQVQLLLELGLVEREPDPADRRAQILTVSDAGRERLDAIATARRAELGEKLDAWADDELAFFVDLLARYNASASTR